MTEFKDSIVSIVSTEPDNRNFGTGFIIRESGGVSYVVTCAHVVRDVGGKDCVAINDRDRFSATVVNSGANQDLDLAILRVEGLGKKAILELENLGEQGRNFLTAGFQKFDNEKIIIRPLKGVLGNPVAVQQLRRSGKMIQAWDLEITDDYSLESGYSGSPVVDEQTGKVLGIVSHKKGEKRGIAIAIEELKRIGRVFDRDRLYKILWDLGYKEQEKAFFKIVKPQSISAFLIHGSVAYGQRWLLNYLVEKHLPETITGKIIKVDLSRLVRRTDMPALWRELGRRCGLRGRQFSPEEIAERVYRWWQTQNVLLIFNDIDINYMPEDYLNKLIREFWTPLAAKAREARQKSRENKLLMFLLDYKGTVGNLDNIFCDRIDPDRPYNPIKPPEISKFSDETLEEWIMNKPREELPIEFEHNSNEIVNTILENSEGGIPEYVLADICDRFGFDWYDEVERWWKL